jgi:alpha-L-fucosidase
MTRIRPILLPLAAVVFGCGLALIVGRATPLAHATPLAQTAPLVQTAPPDAKLPAPLGRPTPQQAAWQDLEVGMFLHFGPQTWQDSEVDLMTTEPSAMNPEKLDTDQWVRVTESMGARILVFVAKHEGGFCWWQTGTTDFGVRNTPWRGGKGDVMADLAASCRTRGMRLGVYLSPQDRKHDVGVGGRAKDAARQAEYERLFRQQLTEVLTKYGEMTEVWFDGSLDFEVGDIVARHAPNAVVFQGPHASIRWVGNEDGFAPSPAWNAVKAPNGKTAWGHYTTADSDPDGNRWLPIECDARIRGTWFWRTDNVQTLKTVEHLMDMYYRSVGHGAGLLLNQTPDRTGLIPEADAARGAEFGAEITRRLGTAIAETRGSGRELTLTLPGPTRIDHVVTMEDIRKGERIREYVIEGQVNGEWLKLAAGTAVGHKKIDRVTPTEVTAVRLRVSHAVGTPQVRRLAVYGR